MAYHVNPVSHKDTLCAAWVVNTYNRRFITNAICCYKYDFKKFEGKHDHGHLNKDLSGCPVVIPRVSNPFGGWWKITILMHAHRTKYRLRLVSSSSYLFQEEAGQGSQEADCRDQRREKHAEPVNGYQWETEKNVTCIYIYIKSWAFTFMLKVQEKNVWLHVLTSSLISHSFEMTAFTGIIMYSQFGLQWNLYIKTTP